MSVWSGAVRAAEETEFDPNQVTPGFEGFVFTGLLAAAIIVLGFLLVSRLRRNSYRAEVRGEIERELAEQEDAPRGERPGDGERPGGATDADGPEGPRGTRDAGPRG